MPNKKEIYNALLDLIEKKAKIDKEDSYSYYIKIDKEGECIDLYLEDFYHNQMDVATMNEEIKLNEPNQYDFT